MVEDVEELRAKLQCEPFAQRKGLRRREVDIPEAGAINLIASQSPEISEWISGGDDRIRERIGIQVASRRRPTWQNRVDAGNDVGALIVVEVHATRVGNDVDRTSGLHGDNGVELPARSEHMGDLLRRRHAVVDGGSPAMTRIEGGRPLLCGQIGRVLRKGRVGKVEIDSV